MKMWHMLKVQNMKHRHLLKDLVIFGWITFEWMEINKHRHRNIEPFELLKTKNRP
jgi:hypothetical protein